MSMLSRCMPGSKLEVILSLEQICLSDSHSVPLAASTEYSPLAVLPLGEPKTKSLTAGPLDLLIIYY